MTPHEIFSWMPASVAAQIFGFLLEKEKLAYKATLETLAKKRNLRPVFLERKPREERFAWMKEALGRVVNDSTAAQLLQIWLSGAQSKMLCDFLDKLGIEHDEKGMVESMPTAPKKEKLAAAVDMLLGKYEREVVAVYLQVFQTFNDDSWADLAEILATDERLKV